MENEIELEPVRASSFNASSTAFEIVSEKLYSNKGLAVIRELVCNALDSTAAAGSTEKVIVREDNGFLTVEDFGLGLDHMSALKYFTTFFASSKEENDEGTGFFGLGCKAPWAVANKFDVWATFGGVTHHIQADRTGGNYRGIHVSSEVTHKPNGVKVEVYTGSNYSTNLNMALGPVHRDLISLEGGLKHHLILDLHDPNKAAPYKNGFLRRGDWILSSTSPKLVLYKNVLYPISNLGLGTCLTEADTFIIKIPSHENLKVHPSRENLIVCDTNEAIVAKYIDLLQEEITSEVNALIDRFPENANPREIQEFREANAAEIEDFGRKFARYRGKTKCTGPILVTTKWAWFEQRQSFPVRRGSSNRSQGLQKMSTEWLVDKGKEVTNVYYNIPKPDSELNIKYSSSIVTKVSDILTCAKTLEDAQSFWRSTYETHEVNFVNYKQAAKEYKPSATYPSRPRLKSIQCARVSSGFSLARDRCELVDVKAFHWVFVDNVKQNQTAYLTSTKDLSLKAVDLVSPAFDGFKPMVRATSTDNYEIVKNYLLKDAVINFLESKYIQEGYCGKSINLLDPTYQTSQVFILVNYLLAQSKGKVSSNDPEIEAFIRSVESIKTDADANKEVMDYDRLAGLFNTHRLPRITKVTLSGADLTKVTEVAESYIGSLKAITSLAHGIFYSERITGLFQLLKHCGLISSYGDVK